MLNLVYQKSAQFRCYHPFHPALDVTRSIAARMLLVFHPILKCFQSLKFSRLNKPQSCNISFIILKEPLFPIFFHLTVVLATSPRRFVSPMASFFFFSSFSFFLFFSFFILKLFWLCFFQRVPIIKRIIFFFAFIFNPFSCKS